MSKVAGWAEGAVKACHNAIWTKHAQISLNLGQLVVKYSIKKNKVLTVNPIRVRGLCV